MVVDPAAIARALVGTGLSLPEIREAILLLSQSEAFRREVLQATEQALSERNRRMHKASSPEDEMIHYVQHLLREEAGLDPVDAAALLRDALQSVSRTPLPPYREKDGFRRWLQRVTRVVPPSEIMHIATRISRDFSKAKNLPWGIRGAKIDDA